MTEIETPSGRVAGRVVDDDTSTVHEFTGIRYGLPPVGPLRLRPPVAVPPWTGVFDATSTPPRSIQPVTMLAPAGDPEDEDCLALNVWTPEPTGSLPVMVWMHGGSFTSGSGSIAWYQGARLARRGVVVVTINYRLGALGFLDLAPLGGDDWAGCTNVGLQDQTLALTWVRDHIAAFGGDPSRVTIFGESAGAMSVSTHLAVPASSGLFRRVIAQSGAAGHVQDTESGRRAATRALDLLGVGPSTLARLADLPAAAFRDVTNTMQNEDPDRDVPLPFRPTVDGSVLPVAPLDALASGAASHIDLLAGTNRDEMNLFRLMALLDGAAPDLEDTRLLRRLDRALARLGRHAGAETALAAYRAHHPDAGNADLWAAVSTDTVFRMPMLAMLDAHVTGGGSAWSYHFTHPSSGFGGALGAAHAVEIPFVFDNLGQPGTEMMLGDVTPERQRFAADVADRWATFATADDLTAGSPGWTVPGTDQAWPAYEPDRRAQVQLDVDAAVIEAHQDDLRELWLGA